MLFKKKAGYGALLAFTLLLCATGYGQVTDKWVVWFPSAGSILSEEAKTAMDDALSGYQQGKRIIGIRLFGYCDTIGSNAYNDRLAMLRVRAVRQYLRLKIPADALFQSVQSYGKRRPLNDNADSAKQALNRRVEIFLSVALPDSLVRIAPIDTLQSAPPSPHPENMIPDSSASREPAPIPLSEALLDTGSLAGRNIVLRNVNFYGDRHVPLPSSYFELEKLANLMLARPGLRIEIQGYVCCMPDTMDGYDAETHKVGLSAQRALFVYQYLLRQGVAASRMSYKGFGASHKRYPQENNEQERELNRRVEIKVLSP